VRDDRVYSTSPALTDALVEDESAVRGVVSGIDGFKACYLLRTGDGCASVTVYDSQDGADESNRAAAGWIEEHLPELNVSAPAVSAGEVVISA
jgi:heme-degrading monooxygenase HmoA